MTVAAHPDFFDNEAEHYAHFYNTLSETELLQRIRRRKWDPSFQLWNSIAAVGSVYQAAPVLLRTIKSQWISPQHRLHCAEALFSILSLENDVLANRLRPLLNQPFAPKRKLYFALLQRTIARQAA